MLKTETEYCYQFVYSRLRWHLSRQTLNERVNKDIENEGNDNAAFCENLTPSDPSGDTFEVVVEKSAD